MMITKPQQNTTFTAYRGADFYGVPETRQSLEYKIKLTPQKIDEIIKSASSTDEGIYNAYIEFAKEGEHVKKAFSGFEVVFKHYLLVMKDRMAEIMQMNPTGSKIPIIGYAAKYKAQVTDSFINRIAKESGNLSGDYNEIVNKFFNNGVNHIVEDYTQLGKYFADGIDYVNTLKGKNKFRTKLSEQLKNNNSSCRESYSSLNTSLIKTEGQITQALEKLVEKQSSKQTKKFLFSTVRKIITAGIG